MALKIKIDEGWRGKYAKGVEEHQQAMARALTMSFRDGAKLLQQYTRTAILSAKLGPRFARQFKGFGFPRRQFSMEPAIRGWHARAFKNSKIGRYANIFARGGTITGHPTLWIPLPTAPAKIAGQAPTPALYFKEIGPLVKLRGTHGRPLLAGHSLKAISGKRATVAQLKTGTRHAADPKGRKTVNVPMFVGVSSVRIKQRLDMDAIFARVQAQLPELLEARLKKKSD
jgi:hypothetical protein